MHLGSLVGFNRSVILQQVIEPVAVTSFTNAKVAAGDIGLIIQSEFPHYRVLTKNGTGWIWYENCVMPW